MISAGGIAVAVSVMKLATAGTITVAIVSGVKFFHEFEIKGKKKGGIHNDSANKIEDLKQRVKARS